MDEIYEGRRKCPRVELETVMMVKTPEGNLVPSSMTNISVDGAQICCDKETAKLIINRDAVDENKQPKITGVFDLELNGQTHKIEIDCKIYYISSIDTHSVALGLLFDEVDFKNNQTISAFVMQAMK